MEWTTATDGRQALAVTASRTADEVLIRRPDQPGQWLVFPGSEWRAFTQAVRAGTFDGVGCTAMTH